MPARNLVTLNIVIPRFFEEVVAPMFGKGGVGSRRFLEQGAPVAAGEESLGFPGLQLRSLDQLI